MDATGASSSLAASKTAVPSTIYLTHELISKALRSSNDQGQTLDLSHLDLTEVTDANARDLAGAAVSPEDGDSDVLRVALGYNRLMALPKAFIALTRLRYLNLRSNLFSIFPVVLTAIPSLEVLDVSRNRIRRLPNDPGNLRNLRVFSISRNRFTKLPHYLTGFVNLEVLKVSHNPIQWPEGMKDEPDDPDDTSAMKRWLAALKAWLDESSGGASMRAENGDVSMSESVRSDYDMITPEADLVSDEDAVAHARNILSTPHARSFSIDSVSTTVSQLSEASDFTSPTDVDESSAFLSPLPSPVHSTTPDFSLSMADDSLIFDTPLVQEPQQHMRNASYSVGGPSRTLGTNLMANKSLPDLRMGFGEGSAQRKARRPPRLPDMPMASPAGSQNVSPGVYSPGFPSATRLRSATHGAVPSSSSQLSQTGETHTSSVDPERNAYFRRFSIQRPPPGNQPAQNLALLAVMDAARGIFFALSQVYEALRQFTVSVTNDGLSSVLQKVLHPARKFLSQLIDSLDRFDEQSKQPNPSPTVCRNVIQACKDSVSVFGKVVGVLNMHLSLVTASHDPRYTRWLLLILHGSMAEVSVSWQTISEHGDAIHPLLKAARSAAKSHAASRSLVSPVTKATETPSPSHQGSFTPNGPEWAPKNRRHAGSFSYKDLQIGRALPATDAPPGTPPPLRRPGHSNGASTPSLNGFATPSSFGDAFHSRDESYSSVFGNGLGSPNGQSTPQPSSASSQNRQQVAAAAVDQDLFATMDETIETASGVWSHLSEILQDSGDSRSPLASALQNAHDITRKLRDDLESIQIGTTPLLRKAMWEDANAFLKAVVQVVTEVKGLEGQQTLPMAVRKAIARLTQLTQEFAMFLQISSFAPSPTGPADGPRSPPSTGSLGRSRSARTPSSEKLTPRPKDVPLSAQPQQQAFKIPPSPYSKPLARRKDEDG
ncbi:hypothetical protein EXIGLDRAFT_774500 [Exidia glandulosa HHB12029]|uniref:L domain-like protein n=1 Tax=Exidia glandulosa HHB12029 TaxID=1314781 RepID=A0A165ZXF8_EXIGL|nr:hypothetical protein EXIGLDRAFT_774500 [Exidia glandulosa HHB12029]